jgi:hypothetical protein
LLPINPLVILAAVFLVGLALFALGLALPEKRRSDVPWPQRVEPTALDLDEPARKELIERLGIIGAPWCETILLQAQGEESDPLMQRAIASALADCREAAVIARPG